MALIDILEESLIKVPLEGNDKNSVIKELVELLYSAGKIIDKDTAIKTIMNREAQGSTGLEDGIAIPHGKCIAVRELTVAIGVKPEGLEFESLDGKPAKLIFLLLTPPDNVAPHIEALSEIGRMSKSKAFCNSLINCKDAKEFLTLLRE